MRGVEWMRWWRGWETDERRMRAGRGRCGSVLSRMRVLVRREWRVGGGMVLVLDIFLLS